MKKWTSKVCSGQFDSEDSMENFLTEMGKLRWEIVSVFPSIFIPKPPGPGEQEPAPREGEMFTFVFKQEVL